jgi:predicted metal-binding membrane protein
VTASDTTVIEDVLRRERLVLAVLLAAVVGLAWVWLLLGAGIGMSALPVSGDHAMGGMAHAMMQPAVWTPGYAALMFAMWWVMMAAMMLPSATPMLLLFARVHRGERAGGRSYVPTGIFAARVCRLVGG